MAWNGTTATVVCLKALLNTVFHQCVAVLMVYSIWAACVNYIPEFNTLSWHVILCSIGLLPLMTEALILYSQDNAWTIELERATRNWIHGALMFLGSSLIISGVIIEINKRHYSFGGHFGTSHGVVGLVAFIFLLISLIFGVLARLAKQLKGYASPNWFFLMHNCVGILTFTLCIASLCTGYHTLFFQLYNSKPSIVAATILTCFVGVWSLIYSLISLYKQIRKQI